jgi:exopolyphosphatase/guanosine-5'-triphosphate,3'-diphosphate pyrophosphatase
MSRKSLDRLGIISRRRAEALPYGAIVLERLLMASRIECVIISAYGLREGILHSRLAPDERAKDPLIEFAADTNRRIARAPGHADELFHWMAPLFTEESTELRRIRQAACLLSDVGWRRHPDDRAPGAFNQVITAPFVGASHRVRALVATAVFHRYSGDEDFARGAGLGGLLNNEDSRLARQIGLAARLGFALSSSAVGELPRYSLESAGQRFVLEIPRSRAAVGGEPVQKRVTALAQALDRRGAVDLV